MVNTAGVEVKLSNSENKNLYSDHKTSQQNGERRKTNVPI